MKKLFILTLAIGMLLSVAGLANAEITSARDAGARLSSEIFTGSNLSQVSTTITTDNRILGFSVTDSAAGSGGLYDTSTEANVDAGTGVFAEAYCAAGAVSTINLILPRKIANGLGICKSATATVVIVYYE